MVFKDLVSIVNFFILVFKADLCSSRLALFSGYITLLENGASIIIFDLSVSPSP